MEYMQFDELWEQEERQGLQRRLQQDYPAWTQRRKRHRTVAATVAVLMVAGVTVLNTQYPSPKSYDGIACNRSGIAEGHWATVAADILTKEMI
jgi:hypothetical protein